MKYADMLKLIEQANSKIVKIIGNDFVHGFTPHANFYDEKAINEITFQLSPAYDITIDTIKDFQSLIQEILPKAVIVVTRISGQQIFKIKMY